MDIYMQDVARLATSFDVTRAIAKVLHSPAFVTAHLPHQPRPVNFLVVLDPDGVPNSIRNGGTGTLTVPTVQLGRNFLDYLRIRRIKVKVLTRNIRFSQSTTIPRRNTVHTLEKVDSSQ
jgi:RNA-dependent RNA polymerase